MIDDFCTSSSFYLWELLAVDVHVLDVNVAPGQYDDGKRFNSDVKGFRIGEKREKRIEQSAGPGAYSPEKADGQTKNKMPNIDLGKSPARPQSFAKGGDVNVAPGQYNHEKKFCQ